MGPILGVGLSVGINDLSLMKRAGKNFFVATAISILTATIYFILTPYQGVQSELLARTSPTLYDVLIALFGGAAGVIAQSTKDKGNVLPGVAIATALMPPLCTAGYGIANGSWAFFAGAFFLYFINTVFIALATYVGVVLMRFHKKEFIDQKRQRLVHRTIVVVVVLTMIPAGYMTVQIIKQSLLDNNMRRFVKNEFVFKGTQIISQNLDRMSKTVKVVAVGKIIDDKDIQKVKKHLANYQLGGYKLNVIQGSQSDSFLLLNKELNNAVLSNETSSQKLIEQSPQINELESQLGQYTRYEALGKEIRNEVKAVCPSVNKVVLTNATEARMDTSLTLNYVVAIVGSKHRLNPTDRMQLQHWLKARVKADSLRLIVSN